MSRRVLVENYSPAAVTINQKNEILYSVGPVGLYLSLPAGEPSHDLLALAPLDLRARLRACIQSVFRSETPETISGGVILRNGTPLRYHIDLRPIPDEEKLQMICFVGDPPAVQPPGGDAGDPSGNRTAMLEQELLAVKAELQGAIRDFEISNEDAQIANEEYKAATDELVEWKTNLEALATDMTELNGKLRESLEAQRKTSGILGNILNNIGAAILLLDCNLKISFFTPAIEAFFHLIPSDIGRPLSDLHYLAPDDLLSEDCHGVLSTTRPLDRDIEMASNRWFLRRILPYRGEDGAVDGLVVSFSDFTETRAMLIAQAAANSEQTRHLTGPAATQLHALQTVELRPDYLDSNLFDETGQELIRLIRQTANALSLTLDNLQNGKRNDIIDLPAAGEFHTKILEQREEATLKIAQLTVRERQITKMVVSGYSSKYIAGELGISQRTVENHRAAIMRKTAVKSLPALARVAFASGLSSIGEPGPEA